MELLRTAANPWGQEVLLGISWNLMWLALAGAVVFVVGHALWTRVRGVEEPEGVTEATPGASGKVLRHSFGARAFHWIMALSMFGLLVTAFVPVIGFQFAWVELHWIAGLVLIAAIVYHVIHALFWQDFWAMWMGARDVQEGMAELRHALSADAPAPPRAGKYPADHKLYHHMAATASLVAVATGLLMMVRIDTPFWTRNPYLLSDGMWGVMYVLHGLSGVALIGLVAAHVYFAVRPERRWITWSMVYGWISRERYQAHFDPERWEATPLEAPPQGGGALADAAAQSPRED